MKAFIFCKEYALFGKSLLWFMHPQNQDLPVLWETSTYKGLCLLSHTCKQYAPIIGRFGEGKKKDNNQTPILSSAGTLQQYQD